MHVRVLTVIFSMFWWSSTFQSYIILRVIDDTCTRRTHVQLNLHGAGLWLILAFLLATLLSMIGNFSDLQVSEICVESDNQIGSCGAGTKYLDRVSMMEAFIG